MDFSIISLFDSKSNEKIEKLKRELTQFGPKESLDWPPHIVLRKGLDVSEENISEVAQRFKEFVKKIKGLKLKIEGFDFFENLPITLERKSPFLITIKIKESYELEMLHDKLNEFKLYSIDDNEDFYPYIPLAFNDVNESSFKKINAYLKDRNFNILLNLDNITLILNKNEKHIIYKKFRI